MDIDLLRTFLEVQRTRHFGRAADNLFVSQSAVSARIRQLEESLGTALFSRDRNNIRLTAAGERLLVHAERIVTTWKRVRQEIALPEIQSTLISIGGMPSLWDILLQEWLLAMHREQPQILVQAEALGAENLQRRVQEGTLDLALLFDPPGVPALSVSELTRIPLLLVSTRPGIELDRALAEDYLLVDWGTSFAAEHARHFGERAQPRMRLGLGRMAQALLLESGGSAYLALPTVRTLLETGRLHPVAGAPRFHRAVYLVRGADGERETELAPAIESLHRVAASLPLDDPQRPS